MRRFRHSRHRFEDSIHSTSKPSRTGALNHRPTCSAATARSIVGLLACERRVARRYRQSVRQTSRRPSFVERYSLPSMMLSQRRGVSAFPPSADLPFGRGAHARFGRCAPLLDSACSLMACNLGLCCVHSFGSRADRSPPEGASCATMSSHTCYRTSRSFHFPFWAECSLSGTQPEFSLGRLHPHVEKDILSLFLASSQFNVLRASTRARRPPGPTWPGCTKHCTWAVQSGPAGGTTIYQSHWQVDTI